MKKLTKIRLINWHYIANETINIKNNVLLTGPNASGKSTIMDAITFLITGGDTAFNLAANEKGKRDLRGYVKCKLGIDDKEYLRDGDVSGHIALEFYDEGADEKFTIGTVIDAFGDLTPVKTIFYYANKPMDDSFFISENKAIYGTVEFRKHNTDFEFYLTKKEAKRGFRTAFGSINEDFFKLIPKALAFKPIPDVKEFIYQNILEEKEIDVSAIKDSIRSYKELEATLKVIKTKIEDLKNIENLYNEVLKINENKDYYQYILKLLESTGIKEELEKAKSGIVQNETLQKSKEESILRIQKEMDALDEESKEIYNALKNDTNFKNAEYINKKINECRQKINEYQFVEERFLGSVASLKENVNKLRKISNNKIYTDLANMSLVKMTEHDVESTKIMLSDISKRISSIVASSNQTVGKLERELDDLKKEMNEIRITLGSLNQNNVPYPTALVQMRNEIQSALKRIYNYDVSIYFFADLVDITDYEWADTIEMYLGNRRFNMIVEPRYYDQALQIFARIKNNYRVYGIGLVNTKQITKFNRFEPNSLASIMKSENMDAQRYINMTCGNVIMCSNEMELERFHTSVTKDGLLYTNYTVTNLNPNIAKPYMGKNVVAMQKAQWEAKAEETLLKYNELEEQISNARNEIEIVSNIDFQALIRDLDGAYNLQMEEVTLKNLLQEKERQDEMTASDLEDRYNKVIASIKNNDMLKQQTSQEIGNIKQKIASLKEIVEEKTALINQNEANLKNLINNNFELERNAKNECDSVLKDMRFDSAVKHFEDLYKTEENSYTQASDTLHTKQYEYINTYSSTYSIGNSEMPKFEAELSKLQKSELITYEQKVREAREAAEIVFREDFLAKLRNNIKTAESEIQKINDTLSTIKFGNDSYEFVFPKSNEYSQFYEMVTSDLSTTEEGILSYDFQARYEQQITELFESLSVDETNSNGAINKFTDYRTYMDYDIKITNERGETMSYSKVFKEKSGGETQVPFYVAIIASFVRVYTKNNGRLGDSIGLVMFDEVFDKMDAARMHAMMNFITSMPLQVIIACPPQRMSLLNKYADTTLIMVRKGSKAQVLPMITTDEDTVGEEEE